MDERALVVCRSSAAAGTRHRLLAVAAARTGAVVDRGDGLADLGVPESVLHPGVAAGRSLVDVTGADNDGCGVGRDGWRDREHGHAHRDLDCRCQTWRLFYQTACLGVR